MLDAQFEYRIKEVLTIMYRDYKENVNQDQDDSLSFSDYIWKNLGEFGRLVYEEVDAWCGMDSLCDEVDKEKV